MLRILSVALAVFLLTTVKTTSSPEDHHLSYYTNGGYRLEQVKPAARRQANHTIHRRTYVPCLDDEPNRRLCRWKHHKPAKPVGPPPDGYRAQLTRAPAALQAHLKQIDALNGGPVKIDAVCRPGGRFFSKSTGRWHTSEHDGCKAVDFTPRPERRSAVLAYARRNIPGHTLTYGWSPHIHVDLAKTAGSKRKQWPVAEPPRDLAKVIPLPRVKTARIPVPRPRPVLASDFAELEIIPDSPTVNLALLDLRAMPVALMLDVTDVLPEPVRVALPPQNIFEAFADTFLQPIPVGNCKAWDKIKPGVKRIVADATRHFSRKYGRTLIAEANSCYRDPRHNRRVGGARYSAHLNFTALDFQITAPDHSFAVPAQELFDFCKRHPLARGCGVYRYKHIIHADVNPVRHRGLVTWDWRARRPTRLAQAKLKKKKKLAGKKAKKKKFLAKKWKKKFKRYAAVR